MGGKLTTFDTLRSPFRKHLYPKRTTPPIKLLYLEFLFDAYYFRRGKKAAISLRTTASVLLQYQIYPIYFDIFTLLSTLKEREGGTKFAKTSEVLSNKDIQQT